KIIFRIIFYMNVMLLIHAPLSRAFAEDSQVIKTDPEVSGVSHNNDRPIEGMIFIKGDCFNMGDTYEVGNSDERPVHKVCVGNFYLGEHEVTQEKWQEIMGNNPSNFNKCGKDCPVEKVSWNDIEKFIKKLNSNTGMNYRLPTEAEWEYSARGRGKRVVWSGTSIFKELEDHAWHEHNSGMKTHAVKTKKPNSLGLYDMSGNVWEWVSDWYGRKYYEKSPRDNPQGSLKGSYRVLRGGSWGDLPKHLRSTMRLEYAPRDKSYSIGFRLAHSAMGN
ncbi:MAG: SUMF1/EgtB/PvdO family nonheme iron enzyme, partial [Nitrospinota bacterium]|nr:SUMF1/EgtB/PvdO family nonheme iron enzyme [Nitrospinota bacterium]